MKRRPKKFLNNSNKMLTALVCILAVVCLVAGGIYIDTFHGQGRFLALIGKTNRTQAQEEDTAVQEDTPKESVAVDAGSKAAVAAFGKEFLLCTKDGVKYYTAVGAQKWSDTFSMTSPTIVQEGDFVAVGDMGGKTVRVYNKEGMVYDLQAGGSPVQFALNETGYLSLITKNDSSYRICVYNRKGMYRMTAGCLRSAIWTQRIFPRWGAFCCSISMRRMEKTLRTACLRQWKKRMKSFRLSAIAKMARWR